MTNKVGLIEQSDKRKSKCQLIRGINPLTGTRCTNTEAVAD